MSERPAVDEALNETGSNRPRPAYLAVLDDLAHFQRGGGADA